MCGILGVTFRSGRRLQSSAFGTAVAELLLRSESRGRESSGIALANDRRISVLKSPISAARLLKTKEFREGLRAVQSGSPPAVSAIGHSRLVTTGGQEVNDNNQPVVTGRVVGVHNGIIVNHRDLRKKLPALGGESDLDSEVLFRLVEDRLAKADSLSKALDYAFGKIDGQASMVCLLADRPGLALYTNHGSLFAVTNRAAGLAMCASERKILAAVLRKVGLFEDSATSPICRVPPGSGLFIPNDTLRLESLSGAPEVVGRAIEIRDDSPPVRSAEVRSSLAEFRPLGRRLSAELEREFEERQEAILALRRCSRCLMPETLPFIEFDDEGVCNYCHRHASMQPRPLSDLEDILAEHRRPDGRPDCLVGLSGGRDSCYALHVALEELKLNPVAFTYDWGMVTDLARRNISRMCGRLGVEHVLVSADIRQKRENVRRNVEAWLRKPDLGMIPLFMAGDKPYFHHARRLRRELGLGVTLLGENMLERTDFKSGFGGVPPVSPDPDRVNVLDRLGKFKMLAHYGRGFATNLGYWNGSLLDTLWAYGCYFVIPREYVNLYRYYPWDEDVVESTLVDGYGWEMSPDTRTSWRIGDGTSAFYNYIYFMVAGFSEIDSLRSNQIREGIRSREQAAALAREENRPRFASIRQYCELIGVDFERAIRTINQIPTRYPR